MINRFSVGGVLALMLALFIIGSPLNSTDVHGQADPTATNTPCGFVQQVPAGIPNAVNQGGPPPTCTAVTTVKTATPTASATGTATSTPAATEVPATAVPTQPAATATSPGGGTAGQISGPNTGTGDGTVGGSGFSWLLVAGALIGLGGAGSLAFGLRRRR